VVVCARLLVSVSGMEDSLRDEELSPDEDVSDPEELLSHPAIDITSAAARIIDSSFFIFSQPLFSLC
jgi:hypothetical protein